MNLTLTNLLRGAAKSVRYLSLALLPALSSEVRAVSAPQHTSTTSSRSVASGRRSIPYLAMVGSPGLRIAEAIGALPEEPKALESRKPVVTPPPEPVKAPRDEIRTEPVPPKIEPTPPPVQPEPVKVEPEPQPNNQLSILPDDTPREVRSEEVLPYFRYPGSNSNAPEPSRPQTPPPLPQSSATYNLK